MDFIPINENKARLTAFFVLVLSLVYLLTQFWLIIAFLLVDFILRAFNLGNYSLLGFLSNAIIRQLKIRNKTADRAPKRFAAGVGVIFTAAILISFLFGAFAVAFSLTIVLVIFAFMESFFSFCAGCYVYNAGKKLKLFR